MELLFSYLEAMSALDRISFDLSLARGLDYYTGVIFEVVLANPPRNVKLGSIGAGGRYDELVGMFRSTSIPCVGCSLGIERIMSIMMMAEEDAAKAAGRAVRSTCTEVLAVTIGKGTMTERLKLAAELWSLGIPTQFCYNENWAVGKQVASAAQSDIPLAVVVGESELKEGVVKLKNIRSETERTIARADIGAEIRKELASLHAHADSQHVNIAA
jgi:histidyl-tRNA synthetase